MNRAKIGMMLVGVAYAIAVSGCSVKTVWNRETVPTKALQTEAIAKALIKLQEASTQPGSVSIDGKRFIDPVTIATIVSALAALLQEGLTEPAAASADAQENYQGMRQISIFTFDSNHLRSDLTKKTLVQDDENPLTNIKPRK